MKIRKIFIERYGPINNLNLDIGEGLQVIWGRNETGKTLAIEAVVKIMLQGKVRDFDHINRVEEDPEGYVLMEDSKSNEIKLTIRKGLVNYLDLRGLDLRNIFIIRDSDLTIKDDCSYYKDITDKLTGLQFERLEKILSLLKDYGRLTGARSDADLSDSKEYGKILSAKKSAVSFIKDAGSYIRKAAEEKLDYCELELIKLKQNLTQAREEIKVQEEALKVDNYRKLSETLKNVRQSCDDYGKVKDYTQGQHQELIKLKAELDFKNEEVKRLDLNLERLYEEKLEQEEKLTVAQSELGPLEDKKKQIDRLEEDIEIYNRRKSEEIREINENLLKVPMFIFLFFIPAGFALAYFTMGGVIWPFAFAGIFLVLFLTLFILLRRSGGTKSKFAKQEFIIKNEFKKLGFNAKNMDEIMNVISNFEDKYKAKSSSADSLNEKIRLLEMKIKEINQNIRKAEVEKIKIKGKIDGIYEQFDVKSNEEFGMKLKLKSKLESELLTSAKTLLGNEDIQSKFKYDMDFRKENTEELLDNIEGYIGHWGEILKEMTPVNLEEGIIQQFKREEYEGLKEKRDRLEKEIEEISEKLKEHNDNLNDFERRFMELDLSRFVDDYSPININTLDRLSESVKAVKEFINKVDSEFETAIESIKIFEEIRNEQETKISDLFEKLNVSRYFEEITDGRYRKVEFDPEDRTVKVIDRNDRIFKTSKLSKGAYDQLFFAIRTALSEEIFGDGRGFFIMDDAFMSSDEYRLENQFKILKKLAVSGWTIIYFSVKSEIKNLALKYSSNKVIAI